jgi:hypothetical protein
MQQQSRTYPSPHPTPFKQGPHLVGVHCAGRPRHDGGGTGLPGILTGESCDLPPFALQLIAAVSHLASKQELNLSSTPPLPTPHPNQYPGMYPLASVSTVLTALLVAAYAADLVLNFFVSLGFRLWLGLTRLGWAVV